MTFTQQYEELERRFREQVASDNRKLSLDSEYVPNFIPREPVDYVLIAMEPSTGVPGKVSEERSQVERNFSWSVEDFILHYCVRKWLSCDGQRSYHLTDLAKGGMKVDDARRTRDRRYERWYPHLQDELSLLNKPGRTRVIAIGTQVAGFLKGKGLCERVERILHYSPTWPVHRSRAIRGKEEQFAAFCRTIDREDVQRIVKPVLEDAEMTDYASQRPEGGKEIDLSESRKKLMFHYMERFRELRNESRIVLNESCMPHQVNQA